MGSPDISDLLSDEPMVLGTFAVQDLRHALGRLTRNMQRIRTQPGWKSSDLAPYKEARNALQRFLPRADANRLTQQDHVELQHAINHYVAYCG